MSEQESSRQTDTDLRSVLERATALANSGDLKAAEALFREALERDPKTIEAHAFLAALAFRQGRYRDAVRAYQTCIDIQPDQPAFHANLATVRELTRDMKGAAEAWLAACRLRPGEPQLALFAGAALEELGRREEAAIMFTLGDDVSPLVRGAKDQDQYSPEIRRHSATADRVIREHLTALHRRATEEAAEQAARTGGGTAPDLSRVRNAIWTQTHDGPVTFRTPKQAPTIFYMPDLEPVPVTPRKDLPWAAHLEAATRDILDEYLNAVDRGAEMAPYVEERFKDPTWSELRGRMDWASLHLFKHGRKTPSADRFPATLAALKGVDVFRLAGGRPVEVFFSRLKPGTHIPPHTGTSNHRLTVHLPLIVPEDCAIRVGDTVNTWRPGEVFAFDDSFEHEAWNRSDRERVVLIFEAHRPDVSAAERLAIEHVFSARERWLNERRIPRPR